MPIREIPGVYFEENVTYELTGEGSKIPVFIGVTGNTATYEFTSYNNENKEQIFAEGTVKLTGVVNGNYSEVEVLSNEPETSFVGQKFYIQTDANANGETLYPLYSDAGSTAVGIYVTVKELYKVDGTQLKKYENWESVKALHTDNNPGIGDASDSNILANTIKEFYEEAKLINSSDVGVPHIYVIDLGEGTNLSAWEKAMKTAKQALDAQVEVYVGAKLKTTGTGNNTVTKSVLCVDDSANGTPDVELVSAMNGIYTELQREAHELDLRYAFTTVFDSNGKPDRVTDDDLLALTNESTGIRKSRIGICEPFLFGKTIARICCTPANTEPGYLVYRSVPEGTFIKRSREEAKTLQNAGIIFNRDEHINEKVYPKMNLCVATSFALSTRPADALFHARFNADSLLREIFEDCYSQIKANESATNVSYLQTRINKRVNDRVTAEEMVKYNEITYEGTKLIANESNSDPYSIVITGQIQPVKCTIAIEVEATIKV